MANYNEYVTDNQANVNFGNTLNMTTKAPLVAKSVWLTLNDAQGWIEDPTSSATAGLNVAVINDGENNGVYTVHFVHPEKALLLDTDPEKDTSLKLVKLSSAANVNNVVGDLNVVGYSQAEINNSVAGQTTFTVFGIEENGGFISVNTIQGVSIVIDGEYNATENKIATKTTIDEALESYNSVVGEAVDNVTNTVVGLIGDMNINTVMGVEYATVDDAAKLTFKGISQTNGVIGQGNGAQELTFAKIATNAVAGNINVDYTYSNGVIGSITGQEATSNITSRLAGLEGLPTYATIVCSTAQNTPDGVVWVNEQHETITGVLGADASTVHKIYLVRQNTTTGDIYDEYITIKTGTEPKYSYSWEKIGSTAGVFEGVEEVADGLIKDAQPVYAAGHYVIENKKLVSAEGKESGDTYTKSINDGLTMASDVKGYVDNTALLTDDIEVMGVKVGNIPSSDYTFAKNMSLTEIIRAIFQKTIGAAVNQTPSLTFTSAYSGNYEVGTTIPTFTLSTAINNKGSYKSADTSVFKLKYGKDSNDNRINADSNGILTANCAIGNITFSATSNPVGTTVNAATGVVNGFIVIDGVNVTMKTTATATSDITPYKNTDEPDSSVRFNNYAINNTATKTIGGHYKFFYGYCQQSAAMVTPIPYNEMFNTQAKIEAIVNGSSSYPYATLTTGWCDLVNKDDSYPDDSKHGDVVWVGNMESSASKSSLVLIVPEPYNYIETTFNNMNQNVPNTWHNPINTVQYTINSTTTNYKVYVIDSNGVATYNAITLKKVN